VAEAESRTNADVAERFQSILASKNLSLYQVSRRSEALYNRSSPYFLPHNLYSDLRMGLLSPSIYQLAALSRISSYRLADWLLVFGLDFEDIPRCQILLHSEQTIRLDSNLGNLASWIPWFRAKTASYDHSPIAPLAELVEPSLSQRMQSLSQKGNKEFIYVKIGLRDALAFPHLLPGSIVRVDPRIPDNFLPAPSGEASKHCFLVDHTSGLCCCRLQAVAKNRIMPVSLYLPCAEIELRVPEEARLLGVADMEIRPLARAVQPEIPEAWVRKTRLRTVPSELRLGDFLRNARTKLGLSFRQASALSREVAGLLGSEQYVISPTSLANYESSDSLPRNLHKVVALCLVYALQVDKLLGSAGIVLEETGQEAIPDRLIQRQVPTESDVSENEYKQPNRRGFLADLREEVDEVPFFLRRSLDLLSGLTAPSLHDFFWIGGERRFIHPYLKNGLLVTVNRRKKTPLHFRSKPLWEQPLYMVLARDGTYLCGCCRVENRTLIVYPYSRGHRRQGQFRYRQDAEIVGQIVTIARKLV